MSGTVVVAEAPSPEEMETVADAAVEIAEVNAERDVALAELSADTTVAVAEIEAVDDEELAWLRNELNNLSTACVTNADTLSALTTRCEALEQQNQQMMETLTAQAAILTLLNPPPPLEEPRADQTEEQNADADALAVPETAATGDRTVRKRRWL